MNSNTQQRQRIAGVFVLATIAACSIASSRGNAASAAGPAIAFRPAGTTPVASTTAVDPDYPVITGAETRATRLSPPRPRVAFAWSFGPVSGTLYGKRVTAADGDDGAGLSWEALATAEHDDYAGAVADLAVGRRGSVDLEGGRVMLHEPLDVLESGRASTEFWSTSARLAVRF